jgi:hypothetical protein
MGNAPLKMAVLRYAKHTEFLQKRYEDVAIGTEIV